MRRGRESLTQVGARSGKLRSKQSLLEAPMSWKSMLLATAMVAENTEEDGSHTDSMEVTEPDARMIRMIIREQLAAFRAGDAQRAWRVASEGIRETFQQPERLLTLIRTKYAPLTNLRQVMFGEWSLTPDGLGIVLDIVDQQYRRHQVMYLVVREADGWRVNGAVVADPEARAEAA